MVTRKIPVAAVLGSMDEKIKAVVEDHYSENPIESTLVEKLTSSFEETGQVVQCEPVEGYPLDVVTQIEPVQNGSGDPSPDNIRPIIGYATCKLYHTGKNLFNIDKALNNVLTKEGENYKCGYFPGVGRQSKYVNLFAPAGATIRLSAEILEDTTTTGYPICMQLYYEDGYNGDTISLVRGETLSKTHGNLKMARIISNIEESGNAAYVVFRNLQVEIGDTATPFEPYNEGSNTFNLDLGQTVYGGSLDWKTGVLTVEYGIQDLSALVWYGPQVAYSNRIYYTDPFPAAASLIAGGRKGWCSVFNCLNGITLGSLPNNSLAYSIREFSGSVRVYIRADDIADMDALMAVLEGQTLVYQLAEPITVQLTPTEILALSGTNTLTSDCGNTTVTGKVDPTAAVEKLTNAIIALGGTV